jgi:hypothetical protein
MVANRDRNCRSAYDSPPYASKNRMEKSVLNVWVGEQGERLSWPDMMDSDLVQKIKE